MLKKSPLQRQYPPHISSFRNIGANWLAAGLYLVTFVLGTGRMFTYSLFYIAWILPLVLFFIERNSGLVRFHAAQAAALYFLVALVHLVADLIGGFGGYYFFMRLPSLKRTLVNLLLRLPALIAAGYGSYLAARAAIKWSEYHLPLLGTFASWLKAKR